MTKQAVSTPVLIVGAGPAGLTTSLLLARAGVPSLLVEKHLSVSAFPRARGVHARAVEILRSCGLEAVMRQQELAITPGAEWRADLTQPPVSEVLVSGPAFAEISPCEGIAIAQDVFESVLQAHVLNYPQAQLRRGTELTGLEENDHAMMATVLDRENGRTSAINARYVVAADGARSVVRDLLGIRMAGPADLGSQYGISFRADLEPYTGRRPRGLYFLTDSGAALFSTHPDSRWALSVPDTGGPADPVATVRRVTGVPDLEVEIVASSRWTAAARTATRYAAGRVFLIGDAAHQTPPAGATGVSTAMADAHNLAWKLAAVINEGAGADLLDTYATERKPVGDRNAAELGAAWTAITSGGQAPSGRSMRQIDMGFRYESAAVMPEDSTLDAGSDAGPTAELDYLPDGAPGSRAPHLWLADGDRRTSVIDLFGSNLTLLTGPSGRAWRTAGMTVGPTPRVVLDVHRIDEPQWPELYGVTDSGAVLVRPDGHVAWRRRELPGAGGSPARRAAPQGPGVNLGHHRDGAAHGRLTLWARRRWLIGFHGG